MSLNILYVSTNFNNMAEVPKKEEYRLESNLKSINGRI